MDVMIILGYESQGELSEIAKQRVDKGIELYKDHKVKILLSGGFSLEHKKDPGFREASLMKDYALSKGVSAEDLLTEEESRDTLGNACFTKRIINSNSWKNILIVTSDFHIKKTQFHFDFVYGEDYDLSYLAVEANLSGEKLNEFQEKDIKSMDIMKKIYKENSIKKGENEKIISLLLAFYRQKDLENGR
jgi:hypothetical protein